MARSTSQPGLEALKHEEGMVLRAYYCPAHVLTIGIGHTNRAGGFKVKPGMTITEKQAMDILRDDLGRNFEPRCDKHLKKNAPQHAFDGTVGFDFNTGRVHNASWVSHYNNGAMKAAEQSFKQWNKGGGKVLKGLVNRRNREWDMIEHGKYGKHRASGSDTAEYQKKLNKLGFNCGAADGVMGKNTKAAVEAFQKTHPNLTNDGIMGRATKAAIDRCLDLDRKSKQGAGGVAGGAAGAGAGVVTDWPSWAVWGLTAILVAFVVYLIYQLYMYKDELRINFNRRRRNGPKGSKKSVV